MGVLLQAFYKMRPNLAVPSPADGDASVPWWWDHLASQAQAFRQAGFTALWLPPVLKTSAGAKPGSDGYGPFDDYDIGSKNQQGTISTRFGTREQLQRSVATMRANGLDVYLDLVEHHRSGDRGNFVFRYRGADGTPNIGRFPKDPLNFRPNVPQDPNLGGRPADDKPFGRELSPINAKPQGYVFDNLIAAADWLTRALDVQGYRLDDVKGISTDFLLPFLNAGSMAGKFAVGEFFDGNVSLVNGWIFNPRGMQGRPSAFDFPLKFLLSAMCNGPGRFNMADLDHGGLAGISPLNAVTFVENHDTDLNQNAIVTNKILGYAYTLTSAGYPCVYYRDYSTDPNCYGLKASIDNLIWIHETLAAGPTVQRWKDFDVFAYERLGGPHLLVGLNNDPGNARTITVATGIGGNVSLHDYTGNAGDVTTRGDGTVTMTIPRNVNGRGYVCYSRQGFGGGFQANPIEVRQQLEGASDLDILPIAVGRTVAVQRVWCAAGRGITANLSPDVTGWTAATSVTLDVLKPDGQRLASKVYTRNAAQEGTLKAQTDAEGFHTLQLTGANTPAANASPRYKLSVSYTAPQTLVQVAPPAQDPAVVGQWAPVFALPNVPIHAHVLPNGKVLFWGRRDRPTDTLDEHVCTPLVWDPASGVVTPTPQPTLVDGTTTVNLFCSGHTFIEDGRLLVTGGHLLDGNGVNQACLYDWRTNAWTATGLMNLGRWYPTAVTLPDGSVLVSSGSVTVNGQTGPNDVQQLWNAGPGTWQSIVNFVGLPLFPRMHVAPNGRVFMSGPLAQTFLLQTIAPTGWTPVGARAGGFRDYAPSVAYDEGKILFIGGGSDGATDQPSAGAEVIDLEAANPTWRPTADMHFPRRQHNATILPDGTVLVTGGSRHAGFNNLAPGQPVHEPELWNPAGETWVRLAAEDVDRCYHSVAVLLPDATVLSGGGGEFRPDGSLNANDPKESHRDAQIFSPPYLFKGPRPVIGAAPSSVNYGQELTVTTAEASSIGRVSWIRLPSVTHSFDQNERINFLKFKVGPGQITVTAPANADLCPPGHYMLFILNVAGVPSIAKIVQIKAAQPVARKALQVLDAQANSFAANAQIAAKAAGTKVTVGVTPTCPYGIGACWGGAYEALTHLQGVDLVRPLANAEDSTAEVYLKHRGLPALDQWPQEFAKTANGTYVMRGVEVTVEGQVKRHGHRLILIGTAERPPIALEPLQAGDRIQWNHSIRVLKPMEDDEQYAYDFLSERVAREKGAVEVTVTGPLKKGAGGYELAVRKVQAAGEQPG